MVRGFAWTVLFGAVAALGSAPALVAQDFAYERLWPALQQPWYFVTTRGIAIDRDDNVFVVDSFNHRIHRYSPDGQLRSRFGQEGLEPGQLKFPIAAATDSKGNLYVAETDTGDFRRIQKFDPNGRPLLQWGRFGEGPGGFGFGVPEDNGFSPFDIEVDASDNVWVSGSNRIQQFDPLGNFIRAIPAFDDPGNPFVLLTGFDVAPDGRIYALDAGTAEVLIFSARGEVLGRSGGPGQGPGEIFIANDLEIDDQGRIYVADAGNGKIIRYEPDLLGFVEWGEPGREEGQFGYIWRLDFDSAGRVYVAEASDDDFALHRIQKFTADGEFLQQWSAASNRPGRFTTPVGVAVDALGRIFVADEKNHRMQVFSDQGQPLFTFGEQGSRAGRFEGPIRVAVGSEEQSRVYVLDSSRVQRFRRDGTFDGAASTTPLGFPGSLDLDRQGNVYVTDIATNEVIKFDADLNQLLRWGGRTECFDIFTGAPQSCTDGRFNEPRSLTIDGFGASDIIIVGDYFNRRLQRFTPQGELLRITPLEFFPTAIEAAPGGEIFLLPFSDSRSAGGHFFTRIGTNGQPQGFWGEFGTNPGQLNSPLDIVRTRDGDVIVSDGLNHRIVRFVPRAAFPNQKAVIVAGGGPFPGNTLWPATQLNANFAYRALTQQGFSNETIAYLSADTDIDLDGDGIADDVDGDASIANLEQAITLWAADADDVIVYLVDHGGDASFRMSGTELLPADRFATMIEGLQNQIPGRITLVYDACQSGSFIERLSDPAVDRVVITSAARGQSAFFVDEGSLSFSSHFWSQIFNGASVAEAYATAHEITVASFPAQTPQLEADGDAPTDSAADLAAVTDQFVGLASLDPGGRPVITAVSPPQMLTDGQSGALFAELEDDDGVSRVWAIVRPPGGVVPNDPNDPVSDLPRRELTYVDEDRSRWEGDFDAFTTAGTYAITFNAVDTAGNRAVPQLTTVTVESPRSRRAVVVDALAGEPDAGRPGERIVRALRSQDYSEEQITYLSADGSVKGVDGGALASALMNAIESTSNLSTGDLLVAIAARKGADDSLQLVDSALPAVELDDQLDDAQEAIGGVLTLVIDGDESGALVPTLAPTGDQQRIVISSTTADQPSTVALNGSISFGAAFWNSVQLGASVFDAFSDATAFLQTSSSPQVPQLEDNGNAIANDGLDGRRARRFSLGAGIMVAGDPPLIGAITPPQSIAGTTSASIEIRDVTSTATITGATAMITPPGQFSGSGLGGKPRIVPMIALGNNQYQLNYDGYDRLGEHQIAVFAADASGRLSTPALTRVVQTGGDAAPGFQVNAGVSGAWFDPRHNGEGWLIQVLDNRRALVYWFTYAPNSAGETRQVWIGAQLGRVEGPTIVVERMITTSGPRFGVDFDSADLELNDWGDVTFHFDDCDRGRMYYRGRGNFGQGRYALERITSLAGAPCSAEPSTQGNTTADGRLSGAWFDPSHNGEGWLLEILPDGRALSVWFTYDRLGRQAWLIGVGQLQENSVVFDLMQRPDGGVFGPAFDPDSVQRETWGTMRFDFSSCAQGAMTYESVDPDFGSGGLQMQPISKIAGLACDTP